MKWKVDKAMAVWGILFGIVATFTGVFVLAALAGGFLAEGFFLLVIGWVLFLVVAARMASWVRSRSVGGRKKDGI
jgi:hypothetical protein